MDRVTTTEAMACGKAILVGEHFVVFGGTALAVPLHATRLRVLLTAREQQRNRVLLRGEWPETTQVERGMRRALKELGGPAHRLEVRVESNFPVRAGLGASAALSVAFSRAVLSLSGPVDDDRVAQAAFEMEHAFHDHPSGIDSTTVAFGAPCYVKTGSRYVNGAAAESGLGFLDIAPGATLLLADSGERCDTAEAVGAVRRFAQSERGALAMEKLVAVSETIALQTANALRQGDFEYVGTMMNENHFLLKALEVSTPRLDALREVALAAGAWGAKVTGGGKGGFLLAICAPDLCGDVRKALADRGVRHFFEQETATL